MPTITPTDNNLENNKYIINYVYSDKDYLPYRDATDAGIQNTGVRAGRDLAQEVKTRVPDNVVTSNIAPVKYHANEKYHTPEKYHNPEK